MLPAVTPQRCAASSSCYSTQRSGSAAVVGMVLHGRLVSWLAMRCGSGVYHLLRTDTDADAVRVLCLWCARRRASLW